jgi:hypothetical protein
VEKPPCASCGHSWEMHHQDTTIPEWPYKDTGTGCLHLLGQARTAAGASAGVWYWWPVEGQNTIVNKLPGTELTRKSGKPSCHLLQYCTCTEYKEKP